MSSELERSVREVMELVNIVYGQNDIAVKMAMKGYMTSPDAEKPEYWDMIRSGLAATAEATGKALPNKGPAGDFRYKEDGESIVITGYKGNNKEVIVPGEIDGKPVTKIGKQAFEYIEATDLIIPDSVTTIEDEACGYGKLVNVTIGDGVKIIGKKAFKSNKIEKLILGKSVVTIDEDAFMHNIIKTLTIPESVKEIGKGAFMYDNEFKEVIIPDGDVFIGKSAFSRDVKVTTVSGTVIDLNKKPEKVKVQSALAKPEAPKNVFCTECGNKLAAGAKFCTNCGKPAVQPQAAQPQTAADSAPKADAPYVIVKCTACGIMPSAVRWFCKSCGTPTALIVPVIGPDLDASKMADRYKIEELQEKITKYKAEKLDADEKAKAYNLVKVHKEGAYSYKLGDNTIIITGYDGASGDIQLPVKINGMSVSEIGEKAFYEKGLTNISIPENIKTIGFASFGNNKITSITIPGTVESVGNGAFSGNLLTSIVIQEGVKEIGESAFIQPTRFGEDVSKIANVVVPGSVKNIGKEAFFRSRIASITISSGVQSIGEKAFSGNQFKEVVIPEGVTEIGDEAFQGNFITNLSLPNSLTKIGDEAFCGNKLPSLSLPPNLAALGKESFRLNKLTEITIPASLKKIGSLAFSENEIERITIQEGVKTIGERAFYRNKITDNKFAGTLLPKSITNIDEEAFMSNKMEGNITIPETVKKIGKGAYCSNLLTGVEVRGETEIGTDAFKNNIISKVIIGSRVPSILAGAFGGNSELVGVTLPESVQIPERYQRNPDDSFNLYTFIERGNTDNLRFDNANYWKNFENEIRTNKAASLPKERITIHNAMGQQIGFATFTDKFGYNDTGGNYRGSRADASIYGVNGGKRIGFINIRAPLHDTTVPENYGHCSDSGVITNDGIVVCGYTKEEYLSDVTGKIKPSMAKELEQYRIGNVKKEGNIGVAYNREGKKVGEVRDAGEFAAVYAGAILMWFK